MLHQGKKKFVCKYCSVLFVWKSNKSLVIDEKERSPMRVLQLNMTNSDKLNFNYAGSHLKTHIELKQLQLKMLRLINVWEHIKSLAENMEKQQR